MIVARSLALIAAAWAGQAREEVPVQASLEDGSTSWSTDDELLGTSPSLAAAAAPAPAQCTSLMQKRWSVLKGASGAGQPADGSGDTSPELKYKVVTEGSTSCPVRFRPLLNETECREIAPALCDRGFGHVGSWPQDPGGCLLRTASGSLSSSCMVHFNRMAAGLTPSGGGVWKICRHAALEEAAPEEKMLEEAPHDGGAPPAAEEEPRAGTEHEALRGLGVHGGSSSSSSSSGGEAGDGLPGIPVPVDFKQASESAGPMRFTAELLDRTFYWISHQDTETKKNMLIFFGVLCLTGGGLMALSCYFHSDKEAEDEDAPS